MPRALHEMLMLHFKMIPLIYESCKSFQKYTCYIFNIYTDHKPCIRYEWTRNPRPACVEPKIKDKRLLSRNPQSAHDFYLTNFLHCSITYGVKWGHLILFQDRDGTVDRRHRSRSKAGGNDKLTTSSSSTSSSDLRSRSKLKNSKTGSVVTFSSKNESKTFTEIDEKTARSIEDSCSSGVQSGSNNSDLDSLNSASPKVNTNPKIYPKPTFKWPFQTVFNKITLFSPRKSIIDQKNHWWERQKALILIAKKNSKKILDWKHNRENREWLKPKSMTKKENWWNSHNDSLQEKIR